MADRAALHRSVPAKANVTMQPQLIQLTGPEAGTTKLADVGGWLLLFCVWFTMYVPARTIFPFISDPKTYWLAFCLALLSLFTGISVWKRTSKALLFARIMLVAFFCAGLFGLGIDIVSSGVRFYYGPWELIVEAILWFLYFKKSKRVAATFGRSL